MVLQQWKDEFGFLNISPKLLVAASTGAQISIDGRPDFKA